MRGWVTGRAITYIPQVWLIWGTRGTQGVSGGSNRQVGLNAWMVDACWRRQREGSEVVGGRGLYTPPPPPSLPLTRLEKCTKARKALHCRFVNLERGKLLNKTGLCLALSEYCTGAVQLIVRSL